MRVRIDRQNRQIVIPVPHFVPPRGHRENLARMIEFALDHFENLSDGSEFDENERPPVEVLG